MEIEKNPDWKKNSTFLSSDFWVGKEKGAFVHSAKRRGKYKRGEREGEREREREREEWAT